MRKPDYSRYEKLKLDRDTERGVLTITISNPGRKNALTPDMQDELEYIFDDAWADDDINVIVLTGEGDAFCAGADVSGLSDQAEAGRPGRPPTRGAKRLFFSMLDCEKPIIAKVRGPAYGLGVNLALAADVVFAADTARFCDSHVKVAIAPGDGGAVLWPLLIGFARAKEYLMTGDPILAPKAEALGLINHSVPDAELDQVVDAFVDKLTKGAPLAIAYAKASVNVMLKQMMAAPFEVSLAYDLLTLKTEDHKEGVAAFAEKRAPRYQGG
ncbi:MAG: enoyl-CoA hydratase/isomerase family protein [Sphingorhabdus sp.]